MLASEEMCESFSHIKGFSDKGGSLVYLENDQHLFVQRRETNGRVYCACYDQVTKGPSGQYGSCGARCIIDVESSTCRRNNVSHTCHENHAITFRDMKSLNTMKDHCRYLAEHFPFSAQKIPIKEIFLSEMAK